MFSPWHHGTDHKRRALYWTALLLPTLLVSLVSFACVIAFLRLCHSYVLAFSLNSENPTLSLRTSCTDKGTLKLQIAAVVIIGE